MDNINLRSLFFEHDIIDLGENDRQIFVDNCGASCLIKQLQEFRKEGFLTDVKLVVDDKLFAAHKIVLASASAYFQAMFSSSFAESEQELIKINDVDSVAMELLLNYAYTGILEVNVSNVQSILHAACLLQFLTVKEYASLFLEKQMHVKNACEIYSFAENHFCNSLLKAAKEFILKNFVDVCEEDEFLDLSEDKIVEFLISDELEIENEEIALKTVLRWYLHDPENRKVNFHKILEHVRLPLISPYFLHDVVENTPEIFNCPNSKKLVQEAKLFHILPERRSELPTIRTKHRNCANVVQVIVIVGGERNRKYLNSAECLDIKSGDSYCLPSLPNAVGKHGLVASVNKNLYVVGGEDSDGTARSSVLCYNLVLGTWQKLKPMKSCRSELGLAIVDGCLYAVGGWRSAYRLETVEKYIIDENVWIEVAPMSTAVVAPACVGHAGKLYVIGGAVLEEGGSTDLVQRYDAGTNSWVKLAPLLLPRSGCTACVFNDYIYVFGGWHSETEYTEKVERYNIEKNEWEFVASMTKKRHRPGVAVVDGTIFVIGGEENVDTCIECYCPDKNNWTKVKGSISPEVWFGCASIQVKKSHIKVETK